MRKTGRRDVLRTGLAGGLAGSLALAASPVWAKGEPVAIPGSAMRLTRRIERDLPGGQQFAVARSWEIAFTRGGRGIAVSGKQLSAKVEAPADLAAIAGIEERRPTDGMWPILLSHEGVIVASGKGMTADARAAAMREVERLIARKRLSPDEAQRHRAFLARLHEIGDSLFARLPGDLFFPRGEPLRRSESRVLPDGREGCFEVVYLALPAAGRDWLGEARREIVTLVGGESLRARESWRMEPT